MASWKTAANGGKERSHGPGIWAIVGVALAGLQWRLYTILNARMDRIEARMGRIEADLTGIKERLSRIEGWIAGRFGEEPVTST